MKRAQEIIEKTSQELHYKKQRNSLIEAETQRLLTEKQTAEYLGISRSTLRQQRHTGPIEGHLPCIPFIKLGRNVRYDRADLEKWIKDNRVDVEQTLKD